MRHVPRGGAVAAASLALLVETAATPARADGWRVEAMIGAVWNAPTSLTIRQRGAPDLRLRAEWSSQSFVPPLYYVVRVGRGDWDLELVHQKLYLQNPPPEVQDFNVSHGYNLLVLSRRWGASGIDRSIGLGVVIAHAENTVRGRPLQESGPGGYRLAGPVLQGMLGDQLGTHRWRGVGEVAASAAWARVKVADGDADVPNLALHARLGAGYFAP